MKTLERVVFNQVSPFLSKHNLLDANQSGFRRGYSTETALLSVTEALRIAKADSKSSVLILLDLSAAFDTVNYQILLTILSSLGITGIPLRWFESYLNGRSFKVAWGGEVSTEHPLVTGILDPSSSPHTLHHWVPSYKHMVSHTIAMLMTNSSISHFVSFVSVFGQLFELNVPVFPMAVGDRGPPRPLGPMHSVTLFPLLAMPLLKGIAHTKTLYQVCHKKMQRCSLMDYFPPRNRATP